MQMNRREFLTVTATGMGLAAIPISATTEQKPPRRCKAVVFDALAIFDPRPVFSLVEGMFPCGGSELNALWKTRQFEYTWLRTLSRQYSDFPSTTRDALVFAARSLKIDLKPEQNERLLDRYFHLTAWPDVLPALRRLREAGVKLGFLSNFSNAMLVSNIKHAGLDDYFDRILSTDNVKAFKPDHRAYQMGIDAFRLKREEIVFAPFAGWDAAGAKSYGYPTFWVNRQNAVEEELTVHPDATGSISDLVNFAL